MTVLFAIPAILSIRAGVLSVLALFLVAATAFAADGAPTGLWKTIDDKTGRPRGLVRIFEHNGELFGRIEASFDPKESKERCDKCPGDRKDKPVIGLVIMRNLKKAGEEWTGGDILDPETGSVYKCKLRLSDQGRKLLLRGFIGVSLLGRTQTWVREP